MMRNKGKSRLHFMLWAGLIVFCVPVVAFSLFAGAAEAAESESGATADDAEKGAPPPKAAGSEEREDAGKAPKDEPRDEALEKAKEQIKNKPIIYEGHTIRDPFKSPIATNISRPAGLEGTYIQEIAIKAILIYGEKPRAIVLGRGKQQHVINVGQKFYDGVVTAIYRDRIVFEQDVYNVFNEFVGKVNTTKYLYPMLKKKKEHLAEAKKMETEY